jgi:hypothetical protein
LRYRSGLQRGGNIRNRVKTFAVWFGVLGLTCCYRVFGTASTQIWNPSIDIQKQGTVHFGIDNYFSIFDNSARAFQLYPDLGVTVGALNWLEVGIDMVQPSPDPLYLNFKFGIPESGPWPAVAAGGFNFGTRSGVTDYNMLYCVAGKSLPVIGRLTFGYYRGMNERLFADSHQGEADAGIIASWDRTLTGKIWACVDYASGNSWYGSLSFGGSYAFSADISLIFGYVVFNDDRVVRNNAFTTQLDITL